MQTSLAHVGAIPAGSSPEHSVLSHLMTIGRLMRKRFQGDSVEPGTFLLLKVLATQGPMRVTELAAFANLDASTVSRHVQQLHRDGLIERSQDPDDGRAQRVALSVRGREQVDAGLARRAALLDKSFEDWDQSDIQTFHTLLARFVGNMESISAEVEQA